MRHSYELLIRLTQALGMPDGAHRHLACGCCAWAEFVCLHIPVLCLGQCALFVCQCLFFVRSLAHYSCACAHYLCLCKCYLCVRACNLCGNDLVMILLLATHINTLATHWHLVMILLLRKCPGEQVINSAFLPGLLFHNRHGSRQLRGAAAGRRSCAAV